METDEHVRLETEQLRRWCAVAGTGLALFALLADVLGVGGSPGLGRRQLLLLGAGGALFATGLTHAAVRGRLRAHADEWTGPDRPRPAALDLMILGATVGMLGGLAEAGAVMIHRYGFEAMVRIGPHVAWMTPLLNAAVLSAVGLLLWSIGRAWGRLGSLAVSAFVFLLLAWDAFFGRIAIVDRVGAEARWIFVGGLAVVGTRAIVDRWERLAPRLRQTAAATAGTVVVVAAALFAAPVAREWRQLAAAGAPPASPNLILIILDTVRASSLSLYGYERPTTPQLERFAATSTVFDRAIAPSPWTLPSHAVLFTGRQPDELSANWRIPLDGTHPTMAEVLSERGYATAAFSANKSYATAEAGLARGFGRFDDFSPTAGEAVRTSVMLKHLLQRIGARDVLKEGLRGRKTAADINRAALAWLDDRTADRPFLLFLNYFDAHDPYEAPAPFDTLFGGPEPLMRLNWGSEPGEALIRNWRDAYDRSIAGLDHQLGMLFDELERRGLLGGSFVIVTSDHGEHIGEHGLMQHGTTLYMPVLHVPLILRGPGVPRGLRVKEPVSLRDVPATLLQAAELHGTPIPGRSLAQAWSSEPRPSWIYSEVRQGVRVPARYPSSQGDIRSVVEGELHYISSGWGAEELYMPAADPHEVRDLKSSRPDALARMRDRLRTHLDRSGTLVEAGGRRAEREP